MIAGVSEEIREKLKDETPLGIITKPEEVANVVYFLSTEEAKLITGQVINASAGFVIN